MKRISIRVVYAIALALGGMAGNASAAEIKVLSTVALQSVMEDLAPQFEKATNHKVTIEFGLGGPLGNAYRTARPPMFSWGLRALSTA
jgi:ABC-type molybdate transport system substrate-binding protein